MGAVKVPVPSASMLVSVGYVGWNVASSVGLILVNKWLFDVVRLESILLLTALHLFCSWLAVVGLIKLGYETYKPMPTKDLALMVGSFFFTIAFFNLSLKFNSVGTYQLSKLLVTPVTTVLQFVLFRKSVSLATQAALLVICLSVAFVTSSGDRPTVTGATCSIIAILSSAITSLWAKSKPAELGLSTYQLNFHLFLWSSICFASASILFESNQIGQLRELIRDDLDPNVAGSLRVPFMILTCAMAASLNLSSAQLIFYTSPLTYHVVGHFKLILILAFGVIYLNSPVSSQVVVGMVGAVAGVMWYTTIRFREAQMHVPEVHSDDSDDLKWSERARV